MKRTKPAPNTPASPVSPEQTSRDLAKTPGREAESNPAKASESASEAERVPSSDVKQEKSSPVAGPGKDAPQAEASRQIFPGTTSLPLGLSTGEPVPPPDTTPPAAQTIPESAPKRRGDRSRIPSILFEGDEPAPFPTQGPRFATASTPASAQVAAPRRELPESYGTGRLLLTARDPRCLYAHWDLTREQLQQHAEAAEKQQLTLRVRDGNLAGSIISEVPVSAQTHHSFIEVNAPGARRFAAELGYYTREGIWQRMSSAETAAAAPMPAGPAPTRFATLRFGAEQSGQTKSEPQAQPLVVVKQAGGGQTSLAPVPEFPLPQPWHEGALTPVKLGSPQTFHPESPQNWRLFAPDEELLVNDPEMAEGQLFETFAATPAPARSVWTAAQQRALAEFIGWSVMRNEAISSGGIEELLRGIRRTGVSEAMDVSVAGSAGAGAELSSAGLGRLAPLGQPGFWFNVNAELVIYGATEPSAKVSIEGQPINLRPDGTFSYRFSLPDGSYHLALRACSVGGEERGAKLQFQRATDYLAGTGVHAQDAALKPPGAGNVD